MTRDRRCVHCGAVANPNGTPTVVVAVAGGQDIYACAVHREKLAGPEDPLIQLAQYQDMSRRDGR